MYVFCCWGEPLCVFSSKIIVVYIVQTYPAIEPVQLSESDDSGDQEEPTKQPPPLIRAGNQLADDDSDDKDDSDDNFDNSSDSNDEDTSSDESIDGWEKNVRLQDPKMGPTRTSVPVNMPRNAASQPAKTFFLLLFPVSLCADVVKETNRFAEQSQI